MYRAFMLLVVFLLELAAMAALAWWGFALDAAAWLRIVAGVGAPVIAAVLWGLYAAPRARFKIPTAAAGVKILVYGAATAAIASIGHVSLAVVFLALVLLTIGLIRLGRLDEGMRDPATPPNDAS